MLDFDVKSFVMKFKCYLNYLFTIVHLFVLYKNIVKSIKIISKHSKEIFNFIIAVLKNGFI